MKNGGHVTGGHVNVTWRSTCVATLRAFCGLRRLDARKPQPLLGLGFVLRLDRNLRWLRGQDLNL